MNISKPDLVSATDRVGEVMGRLNCDKISKAMVAVSWGWTFPTGLRPPTAEEVSQTARRLLDECAKRSANFTKATNIGTGGLVAEYDPRDDMFGITFTVEAAWSGPDAI